ncbi:hypothetical protein NLU13_1190 [Sarocladium strictum]|uniref:U6 snRNA phosphodiesterase n=1 Tax=Sarocladium strictum TaxID=5046 RepID=A0AA39GR96_SARSR|nr:hypothetical protein NLU13_1190 [Sarocladium strictum]
MVDMALVDYSSSSSTASEAANAEASSPPPKRRKDAEASPAEKRKVPTTTAKNSGDPSDADGGNGRALSSVSTSTSDMPPLPDSFHDLYASNARQSVVDDPSLHQGRKRQTPHVVGRWPSHLYIEWRPTKEQHEMLAQLMADVIAETDKEIKLHSLLSSDLGTAQPLHISLSRPISLSTCDKDEFLDQIATKLRATSLDSFTVKPRGLAWYRSPDSDRAFLILRVTSNSTHDERIAPNPELMTLLNRCNTVVTGFKQPALYQRTRKEPVGTAFHVSIGWAMDLPADEQTSLKALYVFRGKRFASLRDWLIEVNGVKAKIGNMVHHIPLTPAATLNSTLSLFER